MPKPIKATPQKKSISSLDDDLYIRFLKELELIGLGLKNSTANLNREVFYKLDRSKPIRRLSEEYGVTEIGEGFFEAEGRYDVMVADGGRTGLEIHCVFEVHMHAPNPIDRSMAQRFSKTDLRFILLPYARHYITSVTAEMQIAPLILPLAAAKGAARPQSKARSES